jgi:predicted RNase H-like HicB family nuclease
MKRVRIYYNDDPDGAWAESPDLPGWTLVGDSLDEVRDLLLESVAFALDGQPFEIEEPDLVSLWFNPTAIQPMPQESTAVVAGVDVAYRIGARLTARNPSDEGVRA